jgi:hypothetical protein
MFHRTRIADVRLADDLFAGFELDHAHAQRRADYRGESGAEGVHHAAIRTGRRYVFLSPPAFADARGFERRRRQRHVGFWSIVFRHGSTGSAGLAARILETPQLSGKVVRQYERGQVRGRGLRRRGRWDAFHADRRLRRRLRLRRQHPGRSESDGDDDS